MPFRTSCIGYVSSQMQSAHVLLEMQSAWGGTEISRERERWRRGAEGALPINRLFEFLLRWACYVSISRGLFRPSARLLAAGGSHTFPSTAHCCLVPCRLSDECVVCVCVCVCVWERERESVVCCERVWCVLVRERRERECVLERVCVGVCVCVEREWCVSERERECGWCVREERAVESGVVGARGARRCARAARRARVCARSARARVCLVLWRARDRARVCVCVCVCERERESVCVCVCVCVCGVCES